MDRPTRVDADLWTWAVEAYARIGVEDLCLDLQDHHGQCVPLLLWAAWSEAAGGPALGRAAALCRQWEDEVTGRLRGARQALKPDRPLIDGDSRERLRTEVKAAELAAERLLLDSLQALTVASLSAPAAPLLTRLRAAASAYGDGATPEALLAELAGRLGAHAVESRPILL